MKTIKIKSALIGLFTLAMFLACGFDVPVSGKIDSPVADAAVSAQGGSTESPNFVVVSLSAVFESTARVIGYEGPVVARYELLGAFAGEGKTSLGSWTDISAASVALVPGSWDFSLEAYDSADKIVSEGSVSAVALTTPKAISFMLAPLQTGTGLVNVTVSWDESSLVNSAKVKFAGIEQPDLPISTTAGKSSVTYVNATANAGNHWLVVTLLDSGGKTVGMAQDRVRVRANLASTGTIVIPSGKLNTLPSAPTDFTASYVVNAEERASFSLSWTDNSTNEAGFDIYHGVTKVASPAAGATSATISGFTRGADYTFSIKAVNAFGESGVATSSSVPAPGFITWDLNGGTNHVSNPASYVPATLPLTLQTPIRACYAFAGWYANVGLTGTPVSSIPIGSTGNREYWAKWTPIDYTITYNLNAGTQDPANPASYTIETANITLAAPTRTGRTFIGWFDNTLCTGSAVTEVPIGSTGNKVFRAKWNVVAQEVSTKIGNMIYVPAGSYQRDATETNISTVSAFLMSECQITRAQFLDIMGTDPSNTTYSSGTTDPVQSVNWYHAIAFCNKLSIAEGLQPVYSVIGIDFTSLTYVSIPTSPNTTWNEATIDWNQNGYRLPTEMEWMWAAMGATSDRTNENTGTGVNTTGYNKPFGGSTGSNVIGNYVWYNINSGYKTHPVKTKTANELGLYNMSGNVFEWCWDWCAPYSAGTLESDTTAGRGVFSAQGRVMRGGGCGSSPSRCTVAYRDGRDPSYQTSNLGFRVVRP